MVISHRKKYLYFVIPKCGSTTVRHALEDYTDIGYPVCTFEQHVTLDQFAETTFMDCFQEYYKFTFIRNPYDRIYSGFLQDLHASKNYPKWINCKAPIFESIGADFNRYVQEYVATNDIIHDWQWICFCPMVQFTHLNGRYSLDFVGRTEYLKEDFKTLCAKMNITDKNISVSYNVNTVPTRDYKYLHAYTADTLEIINALYKADFEAFGYKMLNPSDLPMVIN